MTRARRWARGGRRCSTRSARWSQGQRGRGGDRAWIARSAPADPHPWALLHDAFVIVDEAQSLERNVLLTVLSRMGQNSRVILTHDVGQRDNLRVGRHDGIASVIGDAEGTRAVRPCDPDPLRAFGDRRARHRASWRVESSADGVRQRMPRGTSPRGIRCHLCGVTVHSGRALGRAPLGCMSHGRLQDGSSSPAQTFVGSSCIRTGGEGVSTCTSACF